MASPSNMVTTMWGVCAVVATTAGAGDSYSTCGTVIVVSCCAGGCTVVKRPALVRCVVISTSAGYSVKKGAAVVGTSLHTCLVVSSS